MWFEEEKTPIVAWEALLGAAAGAAAVFFLDPAQGRRRRALARDKFTHLLRESNEAARVVAIDAKNRGMGLMAELRSTFTKPESPDDVLAERVRAELGRHCSHPHAIQVTSLNGVVQLVGPVLKSEHKQLVSAIKRVSGVDEVDDALITHETAQGIPALQGGQHREARFELMQERWSPAARVMMASAGVGLSTLALAKRDTISAGLGLIGLGLIARSAANMPITRLFGIDRTPANIEVEKTIEIAAPLEELFAAWDVEQFPRFMKHVREVWKSGPDTYHWKVQGPAGIPIEWDAVVTQRERNRALAWRTVAGAPVAHAGMVRFERVSDGLTRINVRMAYNPPAGALGHTVAKLLGMDLKSQLDDDLLRFQTLMEEGKATGRQGKVSAEELPLRREVPETEEYPMGRPER